jgi:putative flippase GtrA
MRAAALHFARRYERVLRYIVAGGGVTLLYTLTIVSLMSGYVVADPTLASAIASVLTFPVSFLVHRSITYADVVPDAAQWRRFALIAASNFIVATSTMKIVDLWGWPYWVALVTGWILIPLINYAINAIWVFRAKKFFALDVDGSNGA